MGGSDSRYQKGLETISGSDVSLQGTEAGDVTVDSRAPKTGGREGFGKQFLYVTAAQNTKDDEILNNFSVEYEGERLLGSTATAVIEMEE